jgi:AraC family transcriptional regulator
MSVWYVTRVSESGLAPMPDCIEVLIPGDHSVLEAAFPNAEGRRHTALVESPRITIIPANLARSIRIRGAHEMLVLALDETFYRAKVLDALGVEPPRIALHRSVADPFLRELGNAIRSEFHGRRRPGSAYLESLAAVIAIHLAASYGDRCAESGAGTRSGLSTDKLDRVLAFIALHIADAMPVCDLASTVHMSPCHFARMFKQSVGQPPHAYVTGQRIGRAKELLRGTRLPLVDVAANAGFQTQAHFTGVFRKHTGVTPRSFRLNARAGSAQAVDP